LPSNVFAEAKITPTEVPAGDSTEFVIRVALGAGVSSKPCRFVYDFSATLGTSCPSLRVNEDSGYVQVYVTNPCVTWRTRCWDLDRRHFVDADHPPSREATRMVVLELGAGLGEGDIVELHWGDTYGGFGPGAKVTTVVPRPDYRGTVDVRYFADPDDGMPDLGWAFDGYDRPAPDEEVRLSYRVRPREPHHLRLIRQNRRDLLVPHDLFWNVAEVENAGDLVDCDQDARKNPQGVFEYADPNVTIASRGLPLRETPSMREVFDGMNLYWGDLHTHSCYSCDCLRRSRMDMTPSMLMAFARDRAGLDFYAVTDHHLPQRPPDAQLGEAAWAETIEAVREHNDPGRFVVFPGIEYGCPRGEDVLIFNEEFDYSVIDKPEWNDIREVWKDLRGRDYLCIPHFHNPGQLPEGEWWSPPEPEKEPVLEVFSDHGSYEREDVVENGRAWCKHFRADRCGVWFLKRGMRYGFAAHSDDHKGHVGVNGLTAVLAKELTREAIFEAYRLRRVYGTSNARIRLVFTANGALMGSVIPNTPEKELRIEVIGESALKRIDVFKNGDLDRSFEPEGKTFSTAFKTDDPEPCNFYARVTQLDNHIAISSPIWFE